MRVCYVSENCCSRAEQAALAAKGAGHEIHWVVSVAAAHRQFMGQAETVSAWQPESLGQMAAAVRVVRPDIIHVHDRPHDLMVAVAQANFGVPVVYDPHDLESYMGGMMGIGEPQSLRMADALVWPSLSYQIAATELYGLQQPSVMVPSMVCASLFPRERLPRRRNTAVWEGGLSVNMLNPRYPRAYVSPVPVIGRLCAAGASVDVYPVPTEASTVRACENAGATVYNTQSFVRLLARLTQYDFGWFGQLGSHPQMHAALPNKVFDYTAAGIPTLVVNCRESGAFVEDNGIGVSVKEPGAVADAAVRERLEKIRESLWERRWAFTREIAAEPLMKLYEALATGQEPEQETENHEEPTTIQCGRVEQT